MGGKGLAWVLSIHDTGINEKEEFNNPLRLLEGLINCLWLRKKVFRTMASFKEALNQ